MASAGQDFLLKNLVLAVASMAIAQYLVQRAARFGALDDPKKSSPRRNYPKAATSGTGREK